MQNIQFDIKTILDETVWKTVQHIKIYLQNNISNQMKESHIYLAQSTDFSKNDSRLNRSFCKPQTQLNKKKCVMTS